MLSRLLARFARFLFESHDARRMRRQPLDASDLTVQADIPYIADATPEHLLDIYRPNGGAEDLPVIINIHGGGLFASYKTVNTFFNYEWARLGYTVVSLSYRRLPDTTLVHQISDIMAALRFIRDHRQQYSLNLDRCYLTGDSAGALLAFYALSLEGSADLQRAFGIEPSGIRFRAAALISIMLHTSRRDMLFFLKHIVAAPDEAGAPYLPYIYGPESMVSIAQLPPLQLVTSAEDIIRRDTLDCERLLTDAAVPHHLLDFPKGKQTRLEHVFSVLYPLLPESRQVYTTIDTFFRTL